MIDRPKSDTERASHLEPDQTWPHEVRIALVWKSPTGVLVERSFEITADQFFGHGAFGAPLPPDFIGLQIERMRREGPPAVTPAAKIRKDR